MRDLKFRLRDNNNKILGYEHQRDGRWFYSFKDLNHWFEGFKFLNEVKYRDQFIGELDKNGKEVYEGDIIKVMEHYEGDHLVKTYIGEVVFEDGEFFIKGEGYLREYCSIFDAIKNYSAEVVDSTRI